MNDEYQRFLDLLKQALEEPEIQKKIKMLAGSGEAARSDIRKSEDSSAPVRLKLFERDRDDFRQKCDKLQEQLSACGRERDDSRKKCAELQAQLDRSEVQSDALRKECKRRLTECERERDDYRKKCAELQAQLTGLRQDGERLAEQLRQSQAQEKALLAEKERLTSVCCQLNEEQQPFRPLHACYREYDALPEPLLREFSKILPCDNVIAFWRAGSQLDVLFRLWDAVELRIDELEETNVQTLTRTLEFFLQQYNSLWESPAFKLVADEVGELFDMQRHIRGNGCSIHRGYIEKVLLPGIWNLNLNRMERRCIVFYKKGDA